MNCPLSLPWHVVICTEHRAQRETGAIRRATSLCRPHARNTSRATGLVVCLRLRLRLQMVTLLRSGTGTCIWSGNGPSIAIAIRLLDCLSLALSAAHSIGVSVLLSVFVLFQFRVVQMQQARNASRLGCN